MGNIKRLFIVALAVVLVGVGSAAKVFSQASQDTGSGLSIFPTRTELRIEPGGEDVVRINLRNVTNGNIVANVFANDFESDNETGEPRIIIDESHESATSIKPFISGLENIPLKAGESKTFDIPVSIPTDAAPGAYFGIIRYAAIPEGSAAPGPGQVSLTASVGTIVLIEVPGDIREQIQVRDVLIYRRNVASTFLTSRPEEIGIQIINQGNGFAKPFGTIEVNNPFGKQVIQYELNAANPRSNILPTSSRIFRDHIDAQKISTPGRYTVVANVSFGNGGEVLTFRKSFWYMPLWFIILLLLFIILIGVAIYLTKRRLDTGSFKKPKAVSKTRKK